MSIELRRRSSIGLLVLIAAAGCGGVVRTDGDGPGGASAASGGNTGRDISSMGGALAVGGNGSGGRISGSGGYNSTGGFVPFGGEPGAGGTDGACASISSVIDPGPTNILILLDRSESMSCNTTSGGDRWTTVKKAISTFVKETTPARSIGLQYFEGEEPGDAGVPGDAGPSQDAGPSCEAEANRSPDVEIATFPGQASLIIDSLARHEPGGRKPTAAALAGALRHAAAWGSPVAVALITDGVPDSCGSAADVARVAAEGAKNGVPTFVISLMDSRYVCSLDPGPIETRELDAIARAGGSLEASVVNLLTPGESSIVDALNGVYIPSSLACRFALPALPRDRALDPMKVNVESNGTPLYAVSGAAACDPMQGGWYFDDPVDPTKIELCPESCGALQASRGSLTIYFGCNLRPPYI